MKACLLLCLAVLAASDTSCPKEEPSFHEFDESRMSRAELGLHGWALLHTMAAYYPDEPSAAQLTDAYQFLHLFARMYPCRRCSQHFVKLLQDRPPQFKLRTEFVLYLCELHNVVNALVGKPDFPCELDRLTAKWGGGDCGCN